MCIRNSKPTLPASLLAACVLAVQPNPAAAQAGVDMYYLADAMTRVHIDTDRFVSLENLDDVSAPPGTTAPYQSIQDQGGPYVMFPDQGFFTGRKNLTIGPLAWQGPYINFPQGRIQTGTEPYDQGSLLDPWGFPYLLYNPLGLIRGDQGIITLEYHGDRFDRYTIASLGPDGGVGGGDDLFYEFNGTITGVHLTSLHGPGVTLTSAPMQPPTYDVEAGTTLTLRGYNFGEAAENKMVVFGSTVLDQVLSWTSRQIEVVVPPTLVSTDGFRIQIGTTSTNQIQATITGSHTSVTNWDDY